MENSFRKGWNACINNAEIHYGCLRSVRYVNSVENAIKEFENSINSFAGNAKNSKILKGDVAEFWHEGTFNIKAKVNESPFWVKAIRSQDFASPDIQTNWGDKYSLKYCANAELTAREQSKMYYERYLRFIKKKKGDSFITIEDFFRLEGFPERRLLNEPIYKGQDRLFPSDQYSAGKLFLKNKIAKEKLIRPALVDGYNDTLENMGTRIVAPDNTASRELSTNEALSLAKEAKEGDFKAEKYNLSLSELIQIEQIIKQGVKSGITSAMISLVLKSVPIIYQCMDQLIKRESINKEDLQEKGFEVLDDTTKGFIRGFTSVVLITACQSGHLGNPLKQCSPNIVGALTTIFMETFADSFKVTKGTMNKNELIDNILRNIFVSSLSLGGEAVVVCFMEKVAFAYLLGNLMGGFIGGFTYMALDTVIMGVCVERGWTLFGIVEQDYTLPDEVLKEIGINVFEYKKYHPHTYKMHTYKIHTYKVHTYHLPPPIITCLRRGVIGVHRIGYI